MDLDCGCENGNNCYCERPKTTTIHGFSVKRLVSHAVEKWGNAPQMLQTMEECGELIAAVNQFMRGRKSKYELAEEIADVEIMCAQMRHMIGDDVVDKEKSKKLVRLGERLGLYNLPYGG